MTRVCIRPSVYIVGAVREPPHAHQLNEWVPLQLVLGSHEEGLNRLPKPYAYVIPSRSEESRTYHLVKGIGFRFLAAARNDIGRVFIGIGGTFD